VKKFRVLNFEFYLRKLRMETAICGSLQIKIEIQSLELDLGRVDSRFFVVIFTLPLRK
jgi:hypothetical protein